MKKESEQMNLFPGFVAISSGKDELNFAEFPIATLAKSLDPSVKTVVYEDEIKDSRTGKIVPRKLKITGSDFYGLPTSFDDEVILGLLNLSRLQGFKSPRVVFKRHQIISVLGWRNDTYYYNRIKESIERWLGVSLFFDNAWRNADSKKLESGGMHLIEDITWGKDGEPSSILWNERIFRNFEKGNLKALDLDLYRELKSPTARRLYRFLDKRFGLKQPKWKFDVEKLAFNKIGMRRESYKDIAQVKRQLLNAIKLLEKGKFIMPMDPKERFKKVCKGKWDVSFEKFRHTKQEDLEIVVDEESEAEAKLVSYGVGRTQAERLVRKFGEERVLERIEWFSYRKKKGMTGGIRNIPGYLVDSIRDDGFEKPDDFRSQKEIEAEKALRIAQNREKEKARVEAEKEEKARQEAERAEIEALWEKFISFPADLQEDIRTEACRGFPISKPGNHAEKTLVASEIERRLESGDLDIFDDNES